MQTVQFTLGKSKRIVVLDLQTPKEIFVASKLCLDRRKLPRVLYHAYMRSEAWQEVRRRYWRSKLPKCCYVCSRNDVVLQLHHRTYRRLGCENISVDLRLVCDDHHSRIHEVHKTSEHSLWSSTKHERRKWRRKIRKQERKLERKARQEKKQFCSVPNPVLVPDLDRG